MTGVLIVAAHFSPIIFSSVTLHRWRTIVRATCKLCMSKLNCQSNGVVTFQLRDV